jgi:hypothetical protein
MTTFLSNMTALIVLTRERGNTAWGYFLQRIKYPVTLSALLARISNLASELGDRVSLSLFVYDLSKPGQVELARKEQKGHGGIYIWFCIPTGLFYLGSAVSFFGKNGRLSRYFFKTPNAPAEINNNVGLALATHGVSSFVLIVVQRWPVNSVTVSVQFSIEQLWILLIPTYNTTLRVGHVAPPVLSEGDRRDMSTPLYTYLVTSMMTIVQGSLKIQYGLKEFVRTGYTFEDGTHMPISLYTLYGLLKAGTLYKGCLLVLKNQLSSTASWKPTMLILYQAQPITYTGINTHGVWAYYAKDNPEHVYTASDLHSYYPTVGNALVETGIPGTTFRRLRSLLEPHMGIVYSNSQLHVGEPSLTGRTTKFMPEKDV